MKVSELVPGLYKVRIHRPPRLIKRARNFPDPSASLLRVKGYGEKRTYQIDNELEVNRDRFIVDEEEFEVVRKLDVPVMNGVAIVVTWRDEDGDEFALRTFDTWTLKDMIEQLPFLKEPLNYKPQKRR